MGLQDYKKKRNRKRTPEPFGGKPSSKAPIFVIQEHHASHLHYDFRLEAFGTLKSWAVPKGPSTEIGDKRLAVQVEDHPLDYAKFSGRIPEGEYGAGIVKIWDHGTWQPPRQLRECLSKGHLEFELRGQKLKGKWLLQRTARSSGSKTQWLLIKRHDRSVDASVPRTLPHKKRADPFLRAIEPQLATLSSEVPVGTNWIHEIKLDGYRTLAFVKGDSIRLVTRGGLDWTAKYPSIRESIQKLKLSSAILDGEILVPDEHGNSSFAELQKALKEGAGDSLVYTVFDLLYLNGNDLRSLTLDERKYHLKQILGKASKKIRFSEHLRTPGQDLFKKACAQGLEGIVSKDRSQPYRSGRNLDWQKIKCSLRQEFIIVGYTDPAGSRKDFGALLMAGYERGKLRYVGRVGTGFNASTLKDVLSKLKTLSIKKSPLQIGQPEGASQVHWVKPKLVAEIEFKTWTGDRILRHASFAGLREDKLATDVKIEFPVEVKRPPKPGRSPKPGARKFQTTHQITHATRLIYPQLKITKLDVAQYYRSVAPWFLKYSANRPLSMLRCQSQIGEDCFFQKHIDVSSHSSLYEKTARDQKVIFLKDESGILDLVQLGALEFHTWQCHDRNLESPDQIIMDLDPDPTVPWSKIKDTAFRLKELLEKLDLKSFVKTTGGKGLHVHVPIASRYTWDQAKEFAKTLGRQLAEEYPERYLIQATKKKRAGKIFLDYLRNGFGATAVAPYSLRARANAGVATPISWSELEASRSLMHFDLRTVLKRLAEQTQDPWSGYDRLKQKVRILA